MPEQVGQAGLGDNPEGEVGKASEAPAWLEVGQDPTFNAVGELFRFDLIFSTCGIGIGIGPFYLWYWSQLRSRQVSPQYWTVAHS